MCDIPDIRGMSPRDINRVLNEYRRKMNNDALKCVKIISDPHEFDEALREKEERTAKDEVALRIAEKKATRLQSKEYPNNYVEISEEKVEEIINAHDDDFE